MQISADHAFGEKLPKVAELNALAGSFWSQFFADQKSINAINGSVRQEFRQAIREMHEHTAAAGFHTVPLYHTQTFWPLLINPEDVKHVSVRYGEGWTYGVGGQRNIYYGQVIEDRWQVPIDFQMVDAAAVCDRAHGPSKLWVSGSEAWWRESTLELPVDPLKTFQRITDQYGRDRILIWLYMARFDRQVIAERYGPLLNVLLPSSESYKSSLRAVMQSHTLGSSELRLRELLSALVDEPVAEDGETVVEILADRPSVVVITDRRTVHGKDRTPAVAVGDVLVAGDFFFDTVLLTDFHDGVPDWLDQLTVPKSLSGVDDYSLPAGPIDITAELRDGQTYLYRTGDDHPFWAWINVCSPTLPAMIAKSLKLSVANTANPSPEVFPPAVDVLSVLAESSLRYTVSVSRLRSDALVPGAGELLRLVRDVTSPWVAHLIQFDGPPPAGWQDNGEFTSTGLS